MASILVLYLICIIGVKMKKVLFLIPTLDHGGAEKVLVNLVNNLDDKFFEITVQTLFDGGVNKQYLKPHIKIKSVFKKVFPGNSRIRCVFAIFHMS